MHPDDPLRAELNGEAALLMQEALDAIALSPCQREALLRRVLGRTGRQPPPAPALPPKVG
jgi:hypothetical protein